MGRQWQAMLPQQFQVAATPVNTNEVQPLRWLDGVRVAMLRDPACP